MTLAQLLAPIAERLKRFESDEPEVGEHYEIGDDLSRLLRALEVADAALKCWIIPSRDLPGDCGHCRFCEARAEIERILEGVE